MSTVSVKNKSYSLVVRVPATFCNYLHAERRSSLGSPALFPPDLIRKQ